MNTRVEITKDEVDPTPVLPFARIIAAGTGTNGEGEEVLRLTVMLTPALCDGEVVAVGRALSLANWPGEVHSALASGGFGLASKGKGKIKVEMRHVNEIVDGFCPSPALYSEVGGLPGALVLGSTDLRRDDRIALNSLWQNSLSKTNAPVVQRDERCPMQKQGGWGDLALALRASLQGKATGGGTIAQDGKVEDLDEEIQLGNKGQILPGEAPDTTKVDGIIRVPHADLALALDQQKAQELIVSLQASCGQSDAHINAERRHLDQLAPRDGLENEEDVLDGLSSNARTAKVELNKKIKAQKVKERAQLRASLDKSNRPAAMSAYANEKTRLGLTSCEMPSNDEWTGLTAGGAADDTTREDSFKSACDAHCYATWPQFGHPDDPKKNCDETATQQSLRIVQTYFGVASNPVLARAFGLTVDCELPLSSVTEAVGDDAFLYLGTDFEKERDGRCNTTPVATPRFWTLAHLHRDSDGNWQFWPATEREMHAELLQKNAPISLSQRNGLMMLSTGSSDDPETHVPRFDLTNIDIRTATETETQRRQARQANIDETQGRVLRGEAEPNAPEVDPLDQSLAFAARTVTGGLTLMCRSVQVDAAARLARRDVKGRADTGDVVLDADDLTTGIRLAVGVPTEDGATDWRPMMDRDVTYGTSGPDRGKVEPLLKRFFGDQGRRKWRNELDAGYLVVPSRLLPTGGEGLEAVVEEAIAMWDGSPMGVDCSSSGVARPVADALSFGRTMRLPTSGKRPPPMRFGWPYRVALAAVYSGGVTRSLTTLPDDRNAPDVRDHFYPRQISDPNRTGARPFFRFLRHEKILAPELAMPYAHALRSYSNLTRNTKGRSVGPMGLEECRRMIVRSLVDTDGGSLVGNRRLSIRAVPTIAQRIILPPALPLDDVIRHGVLDFVQSGRPKGALTHLAAARPHKREGPDRENLIVARTNVERGFNAKSYLKERTTEAVPNENLASETVSLGGGVYKRASDRDDKLSSFFPDPTATTLAIGLKRKGHDAFLEGGPILVDLTRGSQFNEITPMVLTVERTDARLCPEKLEQVFLKTKDFRRRWFDLDTDRDVFEGSNRTEFGTDVRLALAPGEAFEVFVWAVPEPETLAREFALVQSLGVLLAQKAGAALFCDPDAMLKVLDDCLPTRVAAKMAPALQSCDPAEVSYVAPGGVSAPTNQVLRAISKVLHEELICHPIAELVAPVTFDAVHACNRATATPEWKTSDAGGLPSLAVLPANEIARPVRAARPPSFTAQNSEPLVVVAPGSRTLVLDGEVTVDLNANDTLEIIARTTLPSSSDFDDKTRGRSMLKRRRGTWPKLRDSDGEPSLDAKGELFRTSLDVFGFNVAKDGQVTHEQSEVVLLRVEGLPVGTKDNKLDLRALFEDRGPGNCRVVHRHVFPDGKARVLELYLNTISRTASDMRTVDRVAGSGDPWLSGEGLVYRRGEQVPGESLERKHLLNRSTEPLTVYMPATDRPAKPDTRAPVPVFAWETGESAPNDKRFKWIKRNATVRIPLGREWYSNGDGELLGIVTWPPTQEFQTVDKRHELTLSGGMPGDPERTVNISNLVAKSKKDFGFEEADLGPGGAFVSRRGGDPVRGLRGAEGKEWGIETRALMGKDDFRDLLRPLADPRRAEFVESVIMPLADQSDASRDAGAAKISPLTVGLIAYKPRFDVEREEWFVDVTLSSSAAPDGFVRFGLVRYQPNTIPALRCSRPDTQWVQVLSERRVSARLSEGGKIHVEMEGHAANDRKLPAGLDEMSADEVRQPNMRLTLFEEREGPSGRARRVLRQSNDNGDYENIRILPKMRANVAIWSHTLGLDDFEKGDAELKLLIEEIEYFRPASYPEEPLQAAATDIWRDRYVEAGPRFSVTMKLDDLIG